MAIPPIGDGSAKPGLTGDAGGPTITQGPLQPSDDNATIGQGDCPSYVPSAAQFENCFNYANTTITNIQNTLIEYVSNVLIETQNYITETYQTLTNYIYTIYNDVYETIQNIYYNLYYQIANTTTNIQETINYYQTPGQPVNVTVPITINDYDTAPTDTKPPPGPCPPGVVPNFCKPEPEKDPCDKMNDWYFFESKCGEEFEAAMMNPQSLYQYWSELGKAWSNAADSVSGGILRLPGGGSLKNGIGR